MSAAEDTNWQYKSNEGVETVQTTQDSQPASSSGAVGWEASEFIEHERGASWYFLLLLITAILAAAMYLLIKDYFAVAVTVVAGVVIAYYAGHKPKQISYEISSQGIRIGEKVYKYNQFRSFSVIREGDHNSISLEPTKRLMPPLSIYFSIDDEERIKDALGDRLPYEERKASVADRLAHRLRF